MRERERERGHRKPPRLERPKLPDRVHRLVDLYIVTARVETFLTVYVHLYAGDLGAESTWL